MSKEQVMHLLQRAAFKLFPALRSFSLSNVASVDSRVALVQHFSKLRLETVYYVTLVACLSMLDLSSPSSS